MLTKKQKELIDFLNQYISKNKISPSFEEMKIAVKLKSKSGIHRLITSLEETVITFSLRTDITKFTIYVSLI